MAGFDRARVWTAFVGDPDVRRTLVALVVAVLVLASAAFLAGLNVRLYDFTGWPVFVAALAVVGGIVRAGLLPTVGSLWLVGAWGYVFPPLVGYLTGEWTPAGRYAYPRMMGYAHGSARGELLGGVEQAVDFGLLLAVVVGTVGYAAGVAVRRLAVQIPSSR